MSKIVCFEDFKVKGTQIVLFGAGVAGELICLQFLKDSYFKDKICFCDNFKNGKDEIANVQIFSFNQVVKKFDSIIFVLTIESDVIREKIKNQIKQWDSEAHIIDFPDIVAIVDRETDGGIPWKDAEIAFDWSVHRNRIEEITAWIDEDDLSVVDFGAGEAYLGTLLKDNVKYIPTDYVSRGEKFLVYDFNSDKFPDLSTDVSVLFQILYYIDNLDEFLLNVCNVTKKKIIICISVRSFKNFAKEFFLPEREYEVIDLLQKEKFGLKERRCYDIGDGNAAKEILLLFEKNR